MGPGTKSTTLGHVDYDTLQRTPKKSFHWFAEMIRAQGAIVGWTARVDDILESIAHA